MEVRILTPHGVTDAVILSQDHDLVTVRSTQTGAIYVVEACQVVPA